MDQTPLLRIRVSGRHDWTQTRVESERGLKPAVMMSSSSREKAQSNIFFLDHMVLPLYQVIADFEPRFFDFIKKMERNRAYW